MMSIPIYVRSIWSYVGDDGGRGAVHYVVSIADNEICTCSYKDEKSSAHSWLGDRVDFLKNFKPYQPPKSGGKWFGKKDS